MPCTPNVRRPSIVRISFGSEESRSSGMPHLQPNQYDPAQRCPESESPQASPSLRANLNSAYAACTNCGYSIFFDTDYLPERRSQ